MGWLDSGWKYRKSLRLSRSSGAVTDYQMKLLIGESSGASGEDIDCHGKCLSTFADLRFTKSDGTTLLDYWVESISGTTPNQLATVWIEFDSIGTSDTIFYMYYGNSGAPSVSNGTNTFQLFDDFDGTTLDTNKWAVNGTPSVSGSVVTCLTESSIGETVDSISTFSGGVALRVKIKNYHLDSTYYEGLQFRNNSTQRISCHYSDSSAAVATKYRTYNSSENLVSMVGATSGNWLIQDINWYGLNSASFYINNSNLVSVTSQIPDVSLYIRFFTSTPNNSRIDCDWCLVRKIVSTEPTWGKLGAEETRTKIYLPFRGTSRFINYTI